MLRTALNQQLHLFCLLLHLGGILHVLCSRCMARNMHHIAAFSSITLCSPAHYFHPNHLQLISSTTTPPHSSLPNPQPFYIPPATPRNCLRVCLQPQFVLPDSFLPIPLIFHLLLYPPSLLLQPHPHSTPLLLPIHPPLHAPLPHPLANFLPSSSNSSRLLTPSSFRPSLHTLHHIGPQLTIIVSCSLISPSHSLLKVSKKATKCAFIPPLSFTR